MSDAAATIFLIVVGLSFLQNVARGTGRAWFAAKFLNRGAPSVPRTAQFSGAATATAKSTVRGAAGAAPIATVPFLDPVPSGKFVSPWGAPREGGARTHKGIDIAAPRGTAVLATASGFAVRVGDGGAKCGTRVAVRHANGVESIYCHLSGVAVRKGAPVFRGQTIGYVGNTGNAATTGPHLHFEIHQNGTATNPAPLVGR